MMDNVKAIHNLKSKDAGRNPTCSFCGVHKDDVPLMITSNVTNANICCFCALTIVNQTMQATQGIVEMNDRLRKERYVLAKELDALKGEGSPIVVPDRKQDAIEKANAAEVDDG